MENTRSQDGGNEGAGNEQAGNDDAGADHGGGQREVYSHGHHESVVQSHARRTVHDSAGYLIDHLRPGVTVLDVGAGPGSITADIAALVAPARVIGLDRSPDVVAQAGARAARDRLENLQFSTGDVYALDFADDSFDVVHAHQVLQHLGDPVAALRQMRRVARPGGIVAFRDADFSAMSWYPRLPELDTWMRLYQQIARGNGAEPDAGRHLIAWAHAAGMTELEASSGNWLYATEQNRRLHAESWAARVLHSDYARQVVQRGLATMGELEDIADGWRRWGEHPDAWFLIPNAEIIAIA